MEKGDMMKLPTLFSAVLLMSSTEINTTMAFQQVVYAETESLSEMNQQTSTEETMDTTVDQPEEQDTTEHSSVEQTTASEGTDDATTSSQEEPEDDEVMP